MGRNQDPFGGFTSQRKLLPVSVLGRGKANTSHKLCKAVRSIKLNTGRDGFDAWRRSIRGFASDQGTERRLRWCPHAEGPASALAARDAAAAITAGTTTLADASEHMFMPEALDTAGHLHIIWNALENAVLSGLPQWSAWYEAGLRSLAKLCGNRSTREAFIASCMAGARSGELKILRQFQREFINWRWETLEDLTSDGLINCSLSM